MNKIETEMKARFTDVDFVELDIIKEAGIHNLTIKIETKDGKYMIEIENPDYMKVEKFT